MKDGGTNGPNLAIKRNMCKLLGVYQGGSVFEVAITISVGRCVVREWAVLPLFQTCFAFSSRIVGMRVKTYIMFCHYVIVCTGRADGNRGNIQQLYHSNIVVCSEHAFEQREDEANAYYCM